MHAASCSICNENDQVMQSEKKKPNSRFNIGSKCSTFLFFFRLKMDRDISYIFFLLLIVSVSITTLGSTIKAKNPNGEVN